MVSASLSQCKVNLYMFKLEGSYKAEIHQDVLGEDTLIIYKVNKDMSAMTNMF